MCCITPYVCFFLELACNVTGLPNGCRTAAAMDNILHMMQARHSFVRYKVLVQIMVTRSLDVCFPRTNSLGEYRSLSRFFLYNPCLFDSFRAH